MGGVVQSGKVVTLKNGGTRRFRSKEERRRIVEETLRPDASVAEVARAHGMNANQLFKWRTSYREGRLETAPASNTANPLLPVKICDAPPVVRSMPARQRSKKRRSGVIDIDLGHARVRIEGAADPDCVRAALEGLGR